MPNVKTKTLMIGSPRFSGLKLMELVNAMYQSGFIGGGSKMKMTDLILKGMDSGDFTELYGIVAEQCPRASPSNPFWDQMRTTLSEEVQE